MALFLRCPVAQLLAHLPALHVLIIGDGVLLWEVLEGGCVDRPVGGNLEEAKLEWRG